METEVFGADIAVAPSSERPVQPLSRRMRAKLAMQLREITQPESPEQQPLDYDLEGLLKGAARRARLAKRAASWPGRGGMCIRRRLRDALRISQSHLATALGDMDVLVSYDNAKATGSQGIAPSRPIPKDIMEQFAAIRLHFGNVAIVNREITAETEPIVLEGFDFGKFRLCYSFWENHFYVEALTPHPCPGNHGVVHPHVRNSSVCLGAGRVAHAEAPRTGRVFDAFVITDRILHTYQRSTAYSPVSAWRPDWHVCNDCGLESETRRMCPCGRYLCAECGTRCEMCGQVRCRNCTNRGYTCAECGTRLCNNCGYGSCYICGRRLCRTCYSNRDHTNTCTACHERRQRRQQEEGALNATQTPRPRRRAEETPPPDPAEPPPDAEGGEDFFGADGVFGSPARLPSDSTPRPQPESPEQLAARILYGIPEGDLFGAQPVVRGAADEPPDDEEPDDDDDHSDDDEPDDGDDLDAI